MFVVSGRRGSLDRRGLSERWETYILREKLPRDNGKPILGLGNGYTERQI